MERSETLRRLRGEKDGPHISKSRETQAKGQLSAEEFSRLRGERFSENFLSSTPENAQKLILWCLRSDPSGRPTAAELLNSDLLPRKIEVEQHYLEEALQLLLNPQSDGYLHILDALFKRHTTDPVEMTFDTDVAAKANSIGMEQGGKRVMTPSEGLIKAIRDIRAGAVDVSSFFAMNNSSLIAATSALKRAKLAGNIGKGGKGVLKRSAQRAAGVFAISAATAAAVEGSLDGVHGADPRIVESFRSSLATIFSSHGAVRLHSPLLRPRPKDTTSSPISGPAEVLNTRGYVLLLPEDLTAPL